MTQFADLADMDEDERIKIIAKYAKTRMVAFVVDDDPPDKVERYIKKVLSYGGIRVIDRFEGPVAGAISVRVGPLGH